MRFYRLPFFLTGTILLASCGEQSAMQTPDVEAREFGAAQKAAAKALSIGNDGALESAESPLDRAVRCRVAVESFNALLANGQFLQSEQALAMRQIVTHYRREAAALGRNSGISSAEINERVREMRNEIESAGNEAATAIACVQSLQVVQGG